MTRSRILTALFALFILAALVQPASAHYDPKLGRWLERDPLGGAVPNRMSLPKRPSASGWPPRAVVRIGQSHPTRAYSDGMNLYKFVHSNPNRFTDFTGLEADPIDAIGGAWNGYWDGSPNFNEEEKKLWKELWAHQKLCMRSAYERAIGAVRGPEYDGTRHNGPGDAVRHCVWNCEMSRCLGTKGAKQWGDAHELGSTNPDETHMDQHNNDQGRTIWEKIWKANKHRKRMNKDPDGFCIEPIWPDDPILNGKCKEECEAALKQGRLKQLPPDTWN